MEHDADHPLPHGHPTSDDGSRLERSVTLQTDVDVAWELVTRPDDLAGWLGREVELEPTPGSEGSVVDQDGTRRRLVVDDVEPGERIAWRWWFDGDDVAPEPSRVEITLTPAIGGTRVDIVEHRLPAGTITARASAAGAITARAGAGLPLEVWGLRLLHLELVVLAAATSRHAVTVRG